MKQLLFIFVFSFSMATYAQCDCEVFSKKMQEYRVKNYQLEQEIEQYAALDSSYQKLLQQQREQILYLKKNQDSLASIPKPLLTHEDEKAYLKKLKVYYLHSGDSTKAAQINQLLAPQDTTVSGN